MKIIKPDNTYIEKKFNSISWYDSIFDIPGWYTIDGELKYIYKNNLIAHQKDNGFYCFLVHKIISKKQVEDLINK